MMDSFTGWVIVGPRGNAWRYVGVTRTEAIMNFMTLGVSRTCYDEAVERAKTGAVIIQTKLTATARKEWPVWYRKGFRAVRVEVRERYLKPSCISKNGTVYYD